VEDSSKLEYQAGQEEEAGDSKDKPKPEAQKQQEQQQQNADRDNDKGDEGEEEGAVNEDIQDKYEDSNFAPPTAPDQVWRSAIVQRNRIAMISGQSRCHTTACVLH